MGQLVSKAPQYRSESDRLELQGRYVVHTALAYYGTFYWICPAFEMIAGDAVPLGMLCRVFNLAFHAAYVGLLLPYLIGILLDAEGYFYHLPSSLASWTFRTCITGPVLWALPWAVLWPFMLLIAIVTKHFEEAKTNARSVAETVDALEATTETTEKAETPVPALTPMVAVEAPKAPAKTPTKSLGKLMLSWLTPSKRSPRKRFGKPSSKEHTTRESADTN
ncbi:hypothetical protein SDRG_13870 [Saprolegnia diclina VS20]|uniref:Uncharacterized protein n=1 Tax=Saprolegnia diclina (strain VS20) TaxID=1156394 RepID=T0RF69_SAPDV|nr:hypothetical protein SDRG_13870 [Saprolegnia diclina VS20]EQC28322.1 hypothetical protein SDRG_13870 [Saprolegnia diclina VS20]|eukprot:XP_008618192.1 hypothetical protein SDRG_13870 [Saprolegnia diclina VS20]